MFPYCAKKKVSIPSASKVTDTQKHRHDENITSLHMRAVMMVVMIIIILGIISLLYVIVIINIVIIIIMIIIIFRL